MMRDRMLFSRARVFALVLALLLGASSASALSSLNIVYLGGATGGQPSPSVVIAEEGDEITFAVTMSIDTGGLGGFAFVLRWDADGEDELDLVGHRERYGGGNGQLNVSLPNPSPPPTNIEIAYNLINDSETQESTPGQTGHVYSYSGTPSVIQGPYINDMSFRMGVVSFRVTNALNIGGPDIELGFFRNTDILFFDDFAGSDFVSHTPNFGSIAVDHEFVPPVETVVTFDGTPPFGALTGVYGGIDWGPSNWYTFDGQFGTCSGPRAIPVLYIARMGFVEPSVLTSIDVGVNRSGPHDFYIASRDEQDQLLEWTVVEANACQTVVTGFTQPAHSILVFDVSGTLLNIAIDNVTYETAAP